LATVLQEKHVILQKKVKRFAKEEIASNSELQTMEGFPMDIWKKMGKEKLLGISIPESYGGIWDDYLSIVLAIETFVRHGHNMGLALSWIIHIIVSRFLFLGFGNPNQQDKYLKDLAMGNITAAIAASEPDIGVSPRHMKTSACFEKDLFILNGEKSFVSNGPIADLFIVFAISGVDLGKNQITAFIVPADLTGVSIGKKIELKFLRPSLHCGIKLINCSIPENNILGKKGVAFNDMLKPFRELEEVFMLASLTGGMGLQIDLLLSLIRKQEITPTNELREAIAELQSIIHTMKILSYETACLMDESISHPEIIPLILCSQILSKNFFSLFKLTMNHSGITRNTDLNNITNDIIHSVNLGKGVTEIKKRKLGDIQLSKRVLYE